MVDIAQSVEHLIVVQKVARSSRVIHPTRKPCSPNGCGVFHYIRRIESIWIGYPVGTPNCMAKNPGYEKTPPKRGLHRRF